jgi:iron complex transport system substrate-binding protein
MLKLIAPAAAVVSLALISVPASAQLAVKDMTGRPLNLTKPAERIVTLPQPAPAILIALDGSTRRLVGMHSASKDAVINSVLGQFFPEAKSIPSDIVAGASPSGFAPNVEAIAGLKPDLVIQWGNRGPDLVQPLENAGIRTGLILYGNEQQARDMIAFVGEAIGKTAKVAELNAWRDKTADTIKAKVASLPADRKPKVLYLLRSKDGFTVSGSGTYNDYYINLTGGVNAAAEIAGQKPVNAEQIAAWNPDVILLNNFEDPLDLKGILDDPILKLTKAATGKRVYKMPMGGYRWDPPSQESPLTWMWLAQLLHPDLFSFDLRAEIKGWYPKLYSKTPTEAQIDDILHTVINKDAAGYEKFAAR